MAEKPFHEELLNRASTLQGYLDLAGVIFVAIDTEGDVIQINKRPPFPPIRKEYYE